MATSLATILPNGKNQFIDQNGVPLVGGKVFFYVPSTSTPKNTWQDNQQSTLNTNPIILDSFGQAIIYGEGAYRQVVQDSLGNSIWDQLTYSTDYGLLPSSGGEIAGNLLVDGTLTSTGLLTANGGITSAGTLTSNGALVSNSTATFSGTTTVPTLTVGDNSTKAASTAFVQSAIGTINFGYTGFRNRIINGDVRIDQRNAGASQTITTANTFIVDRFFALTTGANVTGQQIAASAPDQYLYQFTGATSVTGIIMQQRIESNNIADLAGTTATLSFVMSNSILNTMTWETFVPGTTDNWSSPVMVATGTQAITSTLTRYSIQVSIPSTATKGFGIYLSVGSQTSGTWKIGEVQLESGSFASPFERLPIGVEILLCQRYYVNSNYNGTTTTSILLANTAGSAGSTVLGTFSFPAQMRATPTVAYNGQVYTNGTSLTTGVSFSPSYWSVDINASGSGATGCAFNYTALSEL